METLNIFRNGISRLFKNIIPSLTFVQTIFNFITYTFAYCISYKFDPIKDYEYTIYYIIFYTISGLSLIYLFCLINGIDHGSIVYIILVYCFISILAVNIIVYLTENEIDNDLLLRVLINCFILNQMINYSSLLVSCHKYMIDYSTLKHDSYYSNPPTYDEIFNSQQNERTT
ncbi:ORF MSV223 hypothetical protein [Melanoplus sanguinipes entomopoxvirus]|uniref:Uncharacterized protein n=1 Tax=Melanoplus sanguinipes entomopoxvirus TaxID=83191 RepID=Q9YVL9_MSEPV|nr:ORF MSV223 hypothetical protein [Melanoplus sanguinipes entomopoxvirus]AAC97708.1 ORF MSV223 hypothetical protein [Melanoplus sanguinipes entomopoxvirus 'O']